MLCLLVFLIDWCLARSASCHCKLRALRQSLFLYSSFLGLGSCCWSQQPSSSWSWEPHLGTGWRKAFLLLVYRQVMKFGPAFLDQPKTSVYR